MIALGPAGCVGPDRNDDPGAFVAPDEGERADGELPGGRAVVGPAEARRRHPEVELVLPDRPIVRPLDGDHPAAWPAPDWHAQEPAAWDEGRTGEWDAAGGGWEPADDERDRWEDAAPAGDDPDADERWEDGAVTGDHPEVNEHWEPAGDEETGEWRPEDEWEDDWTDRDEDLGATQEWSAEDVADALGSPNGAGDETADERTDEGRT